MRQNQVVRSANRTIIKMDGLPVGLAQNVRMNDDYSPDAVSGIGDAEVVEYVPTMARYSLTVTNLKLRADSLRQQGLIPENAAAALQGLVFDFIVQDKDTGEVLRKYHDCTYASGDTEIVKHQVVSGSSQFMCRTVSGLGL